MTSESAPESASASPALHAPSGKRVAFLALAALGVVYGDIGTSPLYSVREAFYGPHAVPASPENVLGVLSLIFWSLLLIVTIKYHIVIIRADNKGEGGVVALMALVNGNRLTRGLSPSRMMIILGIFGSALLYADGALTPAISVMGAVEGLDVATPALAHLVVPLTVIILVGLFLLQHHGTANIGTFFGPVMIVWFVVIGLLGLAAIVREPGVLAALSPAYGVRFLFSDIGRGFIVLGAVFLAITGGEALYADLGHFGHTPIQYAWFCIALPGLMLNYFGQGALLLRDPSAAKNPFYHLSPDWALYPLIALATAASVIASQAVITGAFSLTRQEVQLGYSPRVRIDHTSKREIGQIYVPVVNWILAALTVVLVLGFQSSSNIAGAYGVALSALMLITTLMFYVMSREVWGWSRGRAGIVIGLFLVMDIPFFAANALKIRSGGWVPIVIAVAVYIAMTTWKLGRALLRERTTEGALPMDAFLEDIGRSPRIRVPGTAVVMTSTTTGVPTVLLHHLKHNKVLHEQVILLFVMTTEVPEVPRAERIQIQPLAHSFYRVIARYGFMESPDVKEVLALCNERGIKTRPLETSYFFGRERLIATHRKRGEHGLKMAFWRKRLFAVMAHNAVPATQFFGIPPNRVVELGTQIEI